MVIRQYLKKLFPMLRVIMKIRLKLSWKMFRKLLTAFVVIETLLLVVGMVVIIKVTSVIILSNLLALVLIFNYVKRVSAYVLLDIYALTREIGHFLEIKKCLVIVLI